MLLFGISSAQADDVDNKLVQEAMDSYIKEKLSSQGGHYEIKGVKTEFDYLHSGVKNDGSLSTFAMINSEAFYMIKAIGGDG